MQKLFKSVHDMPGVNLTRAEHQIYTNRWLEVFPRSNMAGHIAKPTLEEIIAAAEYVYADAPHLFKAIFLELL